MTQGNTKLARGLLWVCAMVDVGILFLLTCGLSSATSSGGGWLVFATVVAAAGNLAAGVYAIKQGLVFELLMERIFKRVCAGVGMSATSKKLGFYDVGIGKMLDPTGRRADAVLTPRLRGVVGNRNQWEAEITPLYGQSVADYTAHADAFALAFGCKMVVFDIAESGRIRIRAGRSVPVPEPYEYAVPLVHATEPVARVPGLITHADTARRLLTAVPMAIDVNGREFCLPIEGQHLLIAGRTGAGKNSWTWSLVCGLAPAHQAGLVRFWGADPKHIELAIGAGWWYRYADSIDAIVGMLEECVDDMIKRARELQGKARKFTASPAMPLNVVIVDELGYLVALLPDRKLRGRAEKAVSALLIMGRAVGYAFVGAVQDPRKETVGFRDLFPIRVALGLPAPMVDLVLGEGMHEAGALCEYIPLGQAGAGVGYVISEDDVQPRCVRAAWLSDEAIRGALANVPVVPANVHGIKDDKTAQLNWNNQPLSQWQYRVE